MHYEYDELAHRILNFKINKAETEMVKQNTGELILSIGVGRVILFRNKKITRAVDGHEMMFVTKIGFL